MFKQHVVSHFHEEFSYLPSDKPFVCPTCNKEFLRKPSLVMHVAYVHEVIGDTRFHHHDSYFKDIFQYCTKEQLHFEDRVVEQELNDLVDAEKKIAGSSSPTCLWTSSLAVRPVAGSSRIGPPWSGMSPSSMR